MGRDMRKTMWYACLGLLLWPLWAAAQQAVVVEGTLDDHDRQHYVQVPFDVPAGTARISVDFDYDDQGRAVVVDLGLQGPAGFRGWSGGNKRSFTVSASDATPSYLPGAIEPGKWHLLLGVPHLRPGTRAPYRARIEFTPVERADALPASRQVRLDGTARWYRGDLHMHSGHSDGTCAAQSGARVPCPLFMTLQAAADAGLDFIAVTEHNTISHVQELAAAQPYFDRLLLIPGMEITTFQGHGNVFGLRAPLDFRAGDGTDWAAIAREAHRRGLLLSANHPGNPSDETCMGCGWTPAVPLPPGSLAAVEAVNGLDADTPTSGIPYWESLLAAGERVTAIGGSDNHDGTLRAGVRGRSRIGVPTTVVHATGLSEREILDGIRAGRVFVDAEGSRDRLLDLSARAGDQQANMGGGLAAPNGTPVRIGVDVAAPAGSRLVLKLDGKPLPAWTAPLGVARERRDWTWTSDGARHWLRAEVRAPDDRLLLLGNPVYLN